MHPGPSVRPDENALHRAFLRRARAGVEHEPGSRALAAEHAGQGRELRSLADDCRSVPDEQTPSPEEIPPPRAR